jgi:hypothetical protein
MSLKQHQIKIQHEIFGVLVQETFINPGQFQLFLKMIQGCIELKNDLTFFNGIDFFIHIPYKYLVESIILTSTENYTFSDLIIQKSKIESLVP